MGKTKKSHYLKSCLCQLFK